MTPRLLVFVTSLKVSMNKNMNPAFPSPNLSAGERKAESCRLWATTSATEVRTARMCAARFQRWEGSRRQKAKKLQVEIVQGRNLGVTDGASRGRVLRLLTATSHPLQGASLP